MDADFFKSIRVQFKNRRISPDKTPKWLIGVVEFYEKINLNFDFNIESRASVMSVICKDIKIENNFTKVYLKILIILAKQVF